VCKDVLKQKWLSSQLNFIEHGAEGSVVEKFLSKAKLSKLNKQNFQLQWM